MSVHGGVLEYFSADANAAIVEWELERNKVNKLEKKLEFLEDKINEDTQCMADYSWDMGNTDYEKVLEILKNSNIFKIIEV